MLLLQFHNLSFEWCVLLWHDGVCTLPSLVSNAIHKLSLQQIKNPSVQYGGNFLTSCPAGCSLTRHTIKILLTTLSSMLLAKTSPTRGVDACLAKVVNKLLV